MRPQPRQPSGVPSGGQFASLFRPGAVGLDLADDDLVDLADEPEDPEDPEPGDPEDPEPGDPEDPEDGRAPGLAGLHELSDQARRRIAAALAHRDIESGWAEAEASVVAVGRVLAAAIDDEVRRRHPDGFMGVEDDEVDAYRAVTLELLGAIRPLGLPAGEELKLVDSQKPAAAVLGEVSARFPADWLAASQEKDPPIRTRVTPHRAHYAPSRAYWVDEGTQMREVRNVAYDRRRVPAGVEAIESTPGFWTWTSVEPRRVKAQHRAAEILVPSPNTSPAQSRKAATHELTHRLEHANPQLPRLEEAFIRRRCAGEEGGIKPAFLLKGFKKEWARDGGFVDPYIGKIYQMPTFWEVLSTGTESVFDGAYGGLVGRTDHGTDADHRAFVLGCLAAA